MLMVTSDEIPGREISEPLGLVWATRSVPAMWAATSRQG